MGLADFGITEGRSSYIALRGCYPNGINWLRRSVGSLIEIDDCIPRIVRANKTLAQNQELIGPYEARSTVTPLLKERITSLPLRIREEHFVDVEDTYYPVTNQGEGISYALWMSTIVRPWEDMLSLPYWDLNRELSRFAGKYDKPGYNPLTDYEKLLKLITLKIQRIIREREERVKEELKNNNEEEDKPSVEDVGLGKNMDNSDAAKKARLEEIMERVRLKENERIKEYLPAIALGHILENADVGYLLLILTSNEIGLLHQDDSVREGSINIISSLVKAILEGLDREFTNKTFILGETKEEREVNCIEEAIELLQCVSRAVNIRHYGVDDKNKDIREKSGGLELFAHAAGIKIQSLKKELLGPHIEN